MTSGCMGFAPSDSHNAAHGTHMGRTHINTAVGNVEHIPQFIQQRVMAAYDHHGILQFLHGA